MISMSCNTLPNMSTKHVEIYIYVYIYIYIYIYLYIYTINAVKIITHETFAVTSDVKTNVLAHLAITLFMLSALCSVQDTWHN